MPTIVKIRGGEDHFVLLGTGFGMMKSARASRWLGDLFPVENAQEATMVALSDAKGLIHWTSSQDVEVVSIDGVVPAELLKEKPSDSGHLIPAPKSPEGVKNHPNYDDFVKAHESHAYIYQEDLVLRFQEWLDSR